MLLLLQEDCSIILWLVCRLNWIVKHTHFFTSSLVYSTCDFCFQVPCINSLTYCLLNNVLLMFSSDIGCVLKHDQFCCHACYNNKVHNVVVTKLLTEKCSGKLNSCSAQLVTSKSNVLQLLLTLTKK